MIAKPPMLLMLLNHAHIATYTCIHLIFRDSLLLLDLIILYPVGYLWPRGIQLKQLVSYAFTHAQLAS